MSNERITKLLQTIAAQKKMTPDGFTDEKQAASYFAEKEVLLEDIGKALESITDATTTETESVKDAIKTLRESIKKAGSTANVLTRHDIEKGLGKALCAAWTGDRDTLGELSFTPNLKSENWNNPKDFEWSQEKGFRLRKKDALGEPMGSLATNDQYLINPIYEEAIMEDVAKKSVMMPLVTHRPMTTQSIFIPERLRGGIQLNWLTEYGQRIEGSKPNSPTRSKLTAYTLAGYIPWYDEFEEDVYVDLGRLFIDEFTETYGQEFDKQCLIADQNPYTGVLADANAKKHTIASINELSYIDFRDAEIKIPAEERRNCCWFLSETVLNKVANIQDDEGRPIWRRPGDDMPGVIDGYKYYDSSLLPQFVDIEEGTPFAVFMNPKRITHGDRKGIEIKRFEDTTESLEYGELFMRFRKRSGFKVSMAANNIVVLTTAGDDD